MDTGVGRRAYSIIEQGQIDRMINVKPEERRALFEEVAGITKYKSKRKEAEKKLEQTRQNLLRLQDIVNELEKQIRSLKIQATRARKYKELKTELEVVDLYLLGRDLFAHEQHIRELEAKRDELVNLRSELDAQFGQSNAQVTELDILRIDQEKHFQKLGEEERETSMRIQRFENELLLCEERRKYLIQNKESLSEEETEILEKTAQLEQDRERESEEQTNLSTLLSQIDAEVQEREHQIKSEAEKKQQLSQKKETLHRKSSQLSQKEIQLQHQVEFGERKQQEFRDARAELNEKLSDVIVLVENLKQNLSEADSKIEQCGQRAETAEKEVSALHSECETTSHDLSASEDKLFQKREEFHARSSRLQSLKELQENLEGYSPTAKEILHELGENSHSATPLAEILQPEAAIEDHLEMLLGDEMNTLVVRSTQDLEKLAQIIHQRDLEKVRLLAVSELSEEVAATPAELPLGVVPLLSRIKLTPGFEVVGRSYFGAVFLGGSQEEVFDLRRKHPHLTFISNDYRTIGHEDQSLTSGKLPTKMGVFARKREIDELLAECAQLESELNLLTSERERLLGQLESQEKLHSELKDKLSSIHIESVEHRKEREKIQLDLNRTERDYAQITRDSERNLNQLEEIGSQIEQWISERVTLEVEREALTSEIAEVDAEAEQLVGSFEQLRSTLNEQKVERSRLGEKMNSLRFKLERIESELQELESRKDSIASQRVRDEKEWSQLEDRVQQFQQDKVSGTEARNGLLVQISDAKTAFNDTCDSLQRLREKKDELQKQREKVLSSLQETELTIAQEQSSFEHLRGISMERYHQEPKALDEQAVLPIEQLPLFQETLPSPWDTIDGETRKGLLEEHVKNVREKVSRYGEVNLTAIQEFDEIQKRYDFLILQREDLEKSIKILEEAIQKIDESTKIRFEDTFSAVNSKFTEIFPILFNGGKAELSLTNSENMLEAGVDVLVQPPGKRLQSMSLLSGGEKALTAVSLILAIFARKPSPFCLLDEVDAPLDDANVSRFNTVIRKMSEKTQFIVITHNKKTMEIAEALYGVTMERAGISKMTSVRLH